MSQCLSGRLKEVAANLRSDMNIRSRQADCCRFLPGYFRNSLSMESINRLVSHSKVCWSAPVYVLAKMGVPLDAFCHSAVYLSTKSRKFSPKHDLFSDILRTEYTRASFSYRCEWLRSLFDFCSIKQILWIPIALWYFPLLSGGPVSFCNKYLYAFMHIRRRMKMRCRMNHSVREESGRCKDVVSFWSRCCFGRLRVLGGA